MGWENLLLKDEIRNKYKIDILLKTSKRAPKHWSYITSENIKVSTQSDQQLKNVQPSIVGNNHSTMTSDANPNYENKPSSKMLIKKEEVLWNWESYWTKQCHNPEWQKWLHDLLIRDSTVHHLNGKSDANKSNKDYIIPVKSFFAALTQAVSI